MCVLVFTEMPSIFLLIIEQFVFEYFECNSATVKLIIYAPSLNFAQHTHIHTHTHTLFEYNH